MSRSIVTVIALRLNDPVEIHVPMHPGLSLFAGTVHHARNTALLRSLSWEDSFVFHVFLYVTPRFHWNSFLNGFEPGNDPYYKY